MRNFLCWLSKGYKVERKVSEGSQFPFCHLNFSLGLVRGHFLLSNDCDLWSLRVSFCLTIKPHLMLANKHWQRVSTVSFKWKDSTIFRHFSTNFWCKVWLKPVCWEGSIPQWLCQMSVCWYKSIAHKSGSADISLAMSKHAALALCVSGRIRPLW